MRKNKNPKIGLALGSGAARGCAHIGIIKALSEKGIEPDIVCGTSIGALVGASQVTGNLEKLEEWTLSLNKIETAKFFEINTSFNGFVNTKRMNNFLNKYVADEKLLIEDTKTKYAAVAADLETGKEEWFENGSIIKAVWASISLPGLFPAYRNSNKWLVDGGLINPVPISLCKSLGADIVIAVNLNGNIVGKHFVKTEKKKNKKETNGDKLANFLKEYTGSLFASSDEKVEPPNLFDVIAGSVNIAQHTITSRLLKDLPPDILLSPKLSHIGLLEFYRASESIEEGIKCVEEMMPEIEKILN